MHHTFNTVNVAVELTFKYRLKVRLHIFPCHLYNISNTLFAPLRELVDLRTNDLNPVIFDLLHIFRLH